MQVYEVGYINNGNRQLLTSYNSVPRDHACMHALKYFPLTCNYIAIYVYI